MYVGIDAHKRDCHATVLNERGDTISTSRFPSTLEALTRWAKRLPPGSVLALEASTVAKRLYWHLKGMGLDVRMAHPLEVRRRAGNKKKTDAIDSLELADLLRMNRLPEAYVPSPELNERRQLLRYRIDLGKKARLVKNQLHALFVHNGIDFELSDVFGVSGRERMTRMKLPGSQRYLVDGLLAQLDLVGHQIEEIDGQLAELGSNDPAVQELMTLPGVDFYSAQVILEEIGDITRFPSEKQLSSYAGLVPRVAQSGTTLRMGPIHKQGPKALRWILTTCAHGAVKSPGKFQKLFRRWDKRLGKGKAIVAVAHRMIEVIFALLSRGESYSEERAEKTHAKIVRMKNRARALPAGDLNSRWSKLAPVTRELLSGVRG
ncbi:MAG: IS110 family transposase [Thermoplasmata archaeon]|nr:IS110 family transposase [Thermoplasmata archaeon]